MREIKFRAWDEINKIMHYDFQFVKTGDEDNDWILFTSNKQPKFPINDWSTNPYFSQQLKIMQYTGIKDKNGKEIYEGDIISESIYQEPAEYCGEELYQIKYLKSGFAKISIINSKRLWYLCEYFDPHGTFNNLNNIKVIGNIYENPNLC